MVGVVTVAGVSRMGVIVAPRPAVEEIERRFGDEIRYSFGVEPAALTDPEAAYLFRYRNADSLRSRIAQARSARGERLGAQGVPGPEGGDTPGEGEALERIPVPARSTRCARKRGRSQPAMQPEKPPASSQPPSPQTKPITSSDSEMLTPSEQESLRQWGKEALAYGRKAFAHLRPQAQKAGEKAKA